jgi:hypothetical protein
MPGRRNAAGRIEFGRKRNSGHEADLRGRQVLHGPPTGLALREARAAVLKAETGEALPQGVVVLGLWEGDEGAGGGRADVAL